MKRPSYVFEGEQTVINDRLWRSDGVMNISGLHVFTLDGRQVRNKPAKGIYINCGRKYVAR